MDCGSARRLLWPPERPRIVDSDVVAARRHVESCDACRAHFAIDGFLGDLRAGLRETAPRRDIRERLFVAVARARTGPTAERTGHQRWYRVVPTAVLLVIILSVVPLMHGGATVDGTSSDSAAVFVEDYIRLAVREDHIVTTDPAEIRQFLLRELGAAIVPLDEPGLTVTGAEVCLLDGRRGAVIRYRTGHGILTYYLVPAPGVQTRSPTPGLVAEATDAALVTWARDGIERALVGPLPQDSLLGLARRAR